MSNSFVNPIIYGFLNNCFRASRIHIQAPHLLRAPIVGPKIPGFRTIQLLADTVRP